jgi:RimJ/RimL family protein N-acetyltransferase
MKIIETKRLILRSWTQDDAPAFFLINQDPKVLKFLPGPLNQKQVVAFILFAQQQQAERGYSFFAAELKATGQLIGFIGLNYTDAQGEFGAPFSPAVEIGWRLGSPHWEKGYATEGAGACLDYGLNEVGLKEIVSFTVPANRRSIRVMEKIGMERDFHGDFAHPRLQPSHPLSEHILYRIRKERC